MVLSRLNGLIFFAPIPWINICINFQLVEMYRSNWNLNPKKTVPSNSLRARVWTIRQIWICFPVQGCGRMKRKLGSIIPPQYYGPSALAESQIYMRSRQRPWFHKEYSKEKPKQIRAGDFLCQNSINWRYLLPKRHPETWSGLIWTWPQAPTGTPIIKAKNDFFRKSFSWLTQPVAIIWQFCELKYLVPWD